MPVNPSLSTRKTALVAVLFLAVTLILLWVHHVIHDVYTDMAIAIGVWATVGAVWMTIDAYRSDTWREHQRRLKGF